MNYQEIFSNCDKLIPEIIKVLQDQLKVLKKSGYGEQKVSDYRQGVVKKGSIYMPLAAVSHKILFDGYEFILLECFIDVYTNLYESCEEKFAQFAIRTLAIMGIKRVQILFDESVTPEEKNKYRLLLWLADYASIYNINVEHRNTYNKLLDEYKKLLTDKEYEFYSTLLQTMDHSSPVENANLIKKARRNINSLEDRLYSKTSILPLFREVNIIALFIHFSHILHGNVLMLRDIFRFKRSNAPKMRIYWCLLQTGVNVINRIGGTIQDAEMHKTVDSVNLEFKKISEQVRQIKEF